jgi:hypothetical protein
MFVNLIVTLFFQNNNETSDGDILQNDINSSAQEFLQEKKGWIGIL